MPDNQGSQPENQALDSSIPATHSTTAGASESGSGAKPESPSLPSASPNVVESRITWPVPHVIVYVGRLELVCGRHAIMGMGMTGFLEWVYRKLVWKPKSERHAYNKVLFETSKFAKEAVVLATFYDVHGANDTGPMLLSGLGWAEMIENVVKLKVVYEEDPEGEGGL
uniref:CP2 domain-containing protein n=1 Tax=Ganoderma boninense TaxID=34458 RepID=A0A5K1K6R4_9APHY|nr:CP2 domain-containing protein [Ganoderma boninense]